MRSLRTPTRHGRTKPIVLAALLIVLGGTATWLWLRPSTQPNADAGRVVAQEFLQHIEKGLPAEAWKLTTAEFKSAQGQEAFVREVKPLKFLQQPLDFVAVQTVEVARQPRSEFLFRAPSGEMVRIVLGRDEGLWKVDRWVRQ